MLHVGVDEAGYGPVLGPLVVGVAAFRLLDEPEPLTTNLRSRLKGIVVKRPRRRDAVGGRLPVPVDDSKAIHQRWGVEGLARGVGCFAAAMDVAPPADLLDLVDRFTDLLPSAFADRPWYQPLEATPLPRYPWTGPLEDRLHRRHVQAVDLRVLPIDAPDLNREIERTGNKATVLGVAAGSCLLALLDRHPAEDAEIIVDRHGGRLDYAGYLADLFPFASITPIEAPPGEARYRVRLPDRRLHVRFATAADERELAVGWASVAAKLTRELFMDRLNAFFLDRAPDVRRTAGYFGDGRRFLEDVRGVLHDEGIAEQDLVRMR